MRKLIGFLLWNANANPPFWLKGRFYHMKDRLLRRFGEYVGYDIQHIRKECWTCHGTGMYTEKQRCWNCSNGIYKEFWCKLERWQVGNYVFHLPQKKSLVPIIAYDDKVNLIEDYIHHEIPKYHLAEECLYWLALFFDWQFFKMMFGYYGYTGKKFTPMIILATAIYVIKKSAWNRIKNIIWNVIWNVIKLPDRLRWAREMRQFRSNMKADELPF